MTYQEISARRIALDEELDQQEQDYRQAHLRLYTPGNSELPEWQQFCLKGGGSERDNGGITYQKCGGGRRIIRKRIGSN